MRTESWKVVNGLLTAVVLAGAVGAIPVKAAVDFGWEIVDGNYYWYENGIKQGTEGRGKEIYDPDSDAWYWLDAVDGGKKAMGKDVYQESLAGNWADGAGGTGKWVRYDENGHMIKGWNTNENGTYYFDLTYGTMAKGYTEIDGQLHFFDKVMGTESDGEKDNLNGWVVIANEDGNCYWYENGVKQGYDADNGEYRGKEIYDPDSDAWYWLDAVDGGKKAVNKDVYQESAAGDWAENADGIGKWVRYDAQGHMVKGWDENENGIYYFDTTYGTMAKGIVTIGGKQYEFDKGTGVLIREITDSSTDDGSGNTPTDDTGSNENDSTDDTSTGNGDTVTEVTKTELSKCTVTLSATSYTYDGTAKTPSVTVKNGSAVVEADEYTVSYSDNITAGTATVTVTAKRGSSTVSGSAKKTFTINKASQALTVKADAAELAVGETTAITVSGEYGTVSYKSSDASVATVGSEGKIAALKAGTAIITVTAAGDANHESSSVTLTVMVKESTDNNDADTKAELSDCTVTLSQSEYTYDGTAKEPTVTVKKGTEVISSEEYTVSYANNINEGTATVTVTAKSGSGKVKGSASVTFVIVKATEDVENVKYSGMDGEVKWVITDAGELYLTGTCGEEQASGWKNAGWKVYSDEITAAYVSVTNAENLFALFSDCTQLTSADLSNLDTGSVTNMGAMFKGCSSLTELDLSNFDTSNVTNVGKYGEGMFQNCSSLSKLDLSSFDTGNVTNMTCMFSGCSSLSELNLSSFDTSNVTNMGTMFNGCSSLSRLDVSSFDTSNVTIMNWMFSDCSSLNELDVSSFDTSNVTQMSNMFLDCNSLKKLDLTNFDTSNVTTMWLMFAGCSNLTEILVGENWEISEDCYIFQMFNRCGTDHVTLKE